MEERERLERLFHGKSREDMRHMWDNMGDDCFYGEFDCTDIWLYMNMIGDGDYCAV